MNKSSITQVKEWDTAECVICDVVQHYEEMVYLGHEEYECEPCNNRGIEEDVIFTVKGE